MASTIILKNGTGSAVPSSLTHGELAINVDNGALFYGTSGSSNAVSSSFLLSHISSSTITASGEISASGDVYGNNIIASGDLYANDKLFINSKEALEDTGTTLGINEQGQFSDGVVINRGNLPQPLTITGNTTASGNISASGNLFIGDVLNSNGINTIGFSTITDSVNIGPNTTTPIKIHGNVTASGDISASGDMTFGTNCSNIHTIHGEITASCNISASGDIQGTGFYTPTARFLDASANNAAIQKSDGGVLESFQIKTDRVDTTNIKLTGHLTASGNISASGNVIAKEIIVNRTDDGNPGLQVYHATENLLAQFESGDAQALIEFKDNSTTDSVLMGAIGDDISFRTDAGSYQFQILNNTFSALTITGSDARATFLGHISGTKDLYISDITASGGITASGNIHGNGLVIKNADTIRLNEQGGTGNFVIDNGAGSNVSVLNILANTVDIQGGINTDGNSTLGNTVDDTHTFIGNTTASGDISASGTISAQKLISANGNEISLNSDGSIGITAADGQSIIFNESANSVANIKMFDDNEEATFILHGQTGNITSSGNISASGDIIGLNLTATGSTGTVSGISGSFEVLTGTGDTPGLEVEGYISASNSEVLGATGSFNVMTKAFDSYNFYYSVNASSEMYIPIMGSGQEQTFPAYYHLLIAPYDGMVKRVSMAWQSQNPANFVVRTRVASSPGLDINDVADIVEAVSQSAGVDDTSYILDFSSSFNKGDAVCITVQQNGTTGSSAVAGVFTVEYDLTS